MTHPQNLAAMAGSCFQCHVVDDEALVNQVGHPAISDGFEVLSWYSGEVKHNFMVSKGGPVKAHVKEPQVIPPARKRMLFLTGKLSHAAQTLRVLAAATDAPVDQDGTYLRLPNGRYTFAVQHAIELQRITKEMEEVLEQVLIQEYGEALVLIRSLKLKTGHSTEIAAAAEELNRLAEQFANNHDGQEYSAIDGLIQALKPRVSQP